MRRYAFHHCPSQRRIVLSPLAASSATNARASASGASEWTTITLGFVVTAATFTTAITFDVFDGDDCYWKAERPEPPYLFAAPTGTLVQYEPFHNQLSKPEFPKYLLSGLACDGRATRVRRACDPGATDPGRNVHCTGA